MVPFDWRVLDRLGSVWRTYAAKGKRIAPEEHSVTIIVPQTAPAAVSTMQTVTFPGEGQFVWWGTVANVTGTPPLGVNLDYGLPWLTNGSEFEIQPNSPMLFIREGQNLKTFSRHKLTSASPLEGWAPVASITGTGTRPFILPFPVFLNRFDYLEVQFAPGPVIPAYAGAGPDAPTSLGLQLTFLGWKLSV